MDENVYDPNNGRAGRSVMEDRPIWLKLYLQRATVDENRLVAGESTNVP